MKTLFCEDESGKQTTQICAVVNKAPKKLADKIAAMPVSENTRSDWLYFRLANGDLVLGFYPCGDTYFSTESSTRP